MTAQTILTVLQPLLGLAVLTAAAWLLSEDRHAVRFRLIFAGLALQFILALALLKFPPARQIFLSLNALVTALQQATQDGTGLVFGYLGGGAAPFDMIDPNHSFVLAFRALPLILVISALSALLFHWRVLPVLVRGFAWLLRHTLGTGGALGLSAAANVFVGMVEAPLLIRPYLSGMSRSALFGVMTCGMATVAGTVMFLYAGILGSAIPDAMGHILAASVISAPAALLIAGLLVPETHADDHRDPLPLTPETTGAMDAITRGTLDAIPLWLNILAMLVVMVALVGIINQGLGLFPDVAGAPLTAQLMLLALACGFFFFIATRGHFGPPGALIFVFAAGAAMGPVESWRGVTERATATAIVAALAWAICAATESFRQFATPEAPFPAEPARPLGHHLIAAARMTLGSAIAAFAAHAVGAAHPAWAAMGTVAVMQGAHLHISMSRAMQRTAGTVIGACGVWLILAQAPSVWTVIVVLSVLQFATEVIIGANYALGQILVTPMALLMSYLAAGGAASAGMAPERIVDTMLGATIGVVLAVMSSTLDDRVYLAHHHAARRVRE